MEKLHIRKASWDRLRRQAGENFDFFSLAPTPHDEECTPAGGSTRDMEDECRALIGQLVRIHGEPPEGAQFVIIVNPHDFGDYLEAGIAFRPTSREEEENDEESPSQLYAEALEAGIPDHWDQAALEELKEQGHPAYIPKPEPVPGKVVKHTGKVIPIKSKTA